jgi:molybdopterin-guanine dinucleotide biosynthesis protein A
MLAVVNDRPHARSSLARGEPIGAILAGGVGRRIGGSKAVVELCGKPLISYPLEAVRKGLGELVIVAKPDTELPSLRGVAVWIEPATPRHPLVGILHALGLAGGRPVLVCAGDLPFVTAGVVAELVHADPGDAPAVIAVCQGAVQPLLGCYQPSAIGPLTYAARTGDVPLREAVAAIGPRWLELSDPELLFNVNTPDDLLQASAMLDRRRARAPIQT